jgi:hypothetical protein
MPFSLSFEPESGLVIVTCSGSLGVNDARMGAAVFWNGPEWSGKPVVWDLRSAQLDVRGADVQEIARFILERQPETPPPRVAFVAGRDVDFGLMRMFQVYRQHPATQVRVFRDYEEAVSWARTGYPPA